MNTPWTPDFIAHWESQREKLFRESADLRSAVNRLDPDPDAWKYCISSQLGVLAILAEKPSEPNPEDFRNARAVRDRMLSDYERGPDKKTIMLRRMEQSNLVHDLGEARGVLDALRVVRQRNRSWSMLQASRFLSLLGYPTVTPSAPVKLWLLRLGVIDGTANEEVVIQLLESLGQQSTTPLPVVDAIARAHTGRGPCGKEPRCNECALKPVCHYGQQSSAIRPKAEAPPTRLQDVLRPEDLPRERLERYGAGSLSEAELLALILRSGMKGKNVRMMAEELLRSAGSLERLGRMSIGELVALPAKIGPAKAASLIAALEISRRISAVSDRQEIPISGARDVFERYRERFLLEEQEAFCCLLLDSKNRVKKFVEVTRGTVNQSLVHPREAFGPAVRETAVSVIFLHNHPSGDPTPSRDDRLITKQLFEVSRILKITMHDHIVFGRDRFFSFADSGELSSN